MTLTELRARLAAATGPDRELDCDIGRMLGAKIERRQANYTMEFAPVIHWQAPHPYAGMREPCPRFTASLDAAVMLVPEGGDWGASSVGGRRAASIYGQGAAPFGETRAATVPLALCLARVEYELVKCST